MTNFDEHPDEHADPPVAAIRHRWRTGAERLLAKQCVAEFVACALFHFVGSAAPSANALSLACLAHAMADISGAHLNPCVTLVFTMIGSMNPLHALCYVIAQFAGCILAACLLLGLGTLSNGCFTPHDSLSMAQVFGWEACCTYAFLVPHFAVVWQTSHKSGYGSTGPILIALSLAASGLAAAEATGGALNPARALASPVVFWDCTTKPLTYYVIGELTGAVCTALTILPFFGIYQDAWYMTPTIRSKLYHLRGERVERM